LLDKEDGAIVKVAIYIRVSTEEQRINGLSVETQKDVLTEYAKNNNMEIIDYIFSCCIIILFRILNKFALNYSNYYYFKIQNQDQFSPDY
jgi:NADH:ubiquinone oxidoreductase subunit B-like Fe-S oxidoreductase